MAAAASLTPSPEPLNLLAALTLFNIAGRYPEMLGEPPTLFDTRAFIVRATEVALWLQSLL